MMKRFLSIALAVLMAAGAPLVVKAEEFHGSDDWEVSFDGSEMKSNFTSAEMSEEILQIQPGDTITLQVGLANNGDGRTDWYMTNEVLQTLEDSANVAEGGAYTYVLTYHGPSGEENVLYSSEVVGGEEESKEGEGLHQATNSLEDYFYLDRLAEGEKAVVKLVVKLDGETQGNDYQDTLARLQMNFAVEEVNDGTITQIVETGDTAQLMMLSFIALISGLVVLIFAILAMKNRRSGKEV